MSIVALTRDDGAVNGQGGDLAFVRVLGPVQVVTTLSRALAAVGSGDDRMEALERALAMWTGPPFDEFSAEG